MENKFGYINNISYLYGMEKRLHKKTGFYCDVDGNIYNKKGDLLKGGITNHGYKNHAVWNGGKPFTYLAHRIVAECWLDNPDNFPYIDHINNNKLDNRMDNLEWVTHAENMKRVWEDGLLKTGEESHAAKLTDKDIQKIFYLKSLGWSGAAIGREVNVTRHRVNQILKGGWRFRSGQ